MSVGLQKKKLKLLLAGLFLTLPLSLFAEGNLPTVPKAKANATAEYGCVNPIDDMRRNHMEYLLHQRDDTMHRGIRTTKYSLAECVECHVSADDNGNYAEFGESEHFCSSCHNYAAVTIDCFQCHNDKPESAGLSQNSSIQTLPEGHENVASNDVLPSGDAK
ncbi:hypothetical protein MNBD_GAMMA25-1906 [hydrothermal vent metagenome]|uniref:Uncharacterized protein n=1 Tax=hydrothermal vent metagenome TaxID=652676 RepID=A0A3B1BPA6_9ZZZZ